MYGLKINAQINWILNKFGVSYLIIQCILICTLGTKVSYFFYWSFISMVESIYWWLKTISYLRLEGHGSSNHFLSSFTPTSRYFLPQYHSQGICLFKESEIVFMFWPCPHNMITQWTYLIMIYGAFSKSDLNFLKDFVT